MKSRIWPWITALCLCICVAVISLLMLLLDQPPKAPSQPAVSTPALQSDPGENYFQNLFADPNWPELYALAGIADTPFENAATFDAYMNDKVGSNALTCQEVYTDSADIRRFLVWCGRDKIAAFELAGPDFIVKSLAFFVDRSISITVQTPPDYTVFVNGTPLDETYTVRTLQTKAESYLPEGIHGVRWRWQTVSGFMLAPTVTAVDVDGNAVALEYQDGVYSIQENTEGTISQQQVDFLSAAGVADARFAIGEISKAELAIYFDESTELYHMLTTNPRNIQKYTSSTVENIQVGEYVQYSDCLFSANVKLTQKIIRTSGTLKTYTMDKTYFFVLTPAGEYRVIAYTNEHMTELVETVKLIYHLPSGEVVSYMVDANALSVPVPELDGTYDLLGWTMMAQLEDDTLLYTVRVMPDGTVLGGLEPMVLFPYSDAE